MVEKFLQAKHWQIFLLIFGVPMIFQLSMMSIMFIQMISNSNQHIYSVFNYMWIFPLIMLLVGGVLFGWLWSVAIGLQAKVPANVKMNVSRFKIFFFVPLFYIFFVISLFTTTMNGVGPMFNLFFLIVPIHLFSIFCLFYSLYFVAKTFKTVELQREVTFSDFAGEFFMLWFYPIGIWIIQPKINKMAEE